MEAWVLVVFFAGTSQSMKQEGRNRPSTIVTFCFLLHKRRVAVLVESGKRLKGVCAQCRPLETWNVLVNLRFEKLGVGVVPDKGDILVIRNDEFPEGARD